MESKIPKFEVLLLTYPCWSRASYISFVCATKKKEIRASARRPFLWFFVLFSLETNVRAFEWMTTLEGSIYVWQVFGEDSLVLRALPLENGWSRRRPTHFWRKSPRDEVVGKRRGVRVHRRAWKQERDSLLSSPHASCSCSVLARIHFSFPLPPPPTGYVLIRLKSGVMIWVGDCKCRVHAVPSKKANELFLEQGADYY